MYKDIIDYLRECGISEDILKKVGNMGHIPCEPINFGGSAGSGKNMRCSSLDINSLA